MTVSGPAMPAKVLVSLVTVVVFVPCASRDNGVRTRGGAFIASVLPPFPCQKFRFAIPLNAIPLAPIP